MYFYYPLKYINLCFSKLKFIPTSKIVSLVYRLYIFEVFKLISVFSKKSVKGKTIE